MFWLYFASLSLFLLAGHARFATSRSIGEQPVPGTALHEAYLWMGGALCTFAIVALLGWGFASYTWWVPLASAIGGYVLARAIYAALPIGATYVLAGFPLGLASGVAMVLTA